jgi:hypothetical protein
MFTDLQTALAVCKQYSGIDADDEEWDASLAVFLAASKATESYRPILVAAMQVLKFSSGITRAGLSSADGAKWLDPKQAQEAITGYLLEQEALDGGLSGIPPTWTISFLRPKLCGCDSAAIHIPLFGALYA